jgi:hypothetical protein
MFDRQAAFLLSDGSIVGLDGSSPIQFSHILTNQLFVVIRHRNHLDVMSAIGLTESAGVYTYDFTSGPGQAFGANSQKNLGGGIYGMYGGDANADGSINILDTMDAWKVQTGTSAYLSGDGNLNAQVNNQDKNDLIIINTGQMSMVPE